MAELSEAELEELERKAKEGAQGEWIDHGPSGVITVKQGKQEFDVAGRVWDDEDRAHIVAFQPSVALRLIAELRDLRRQNADNAEWRKEFKAQRDSLIDVINQMQKQVKNA